MLLHDARRRAGLSQVELGRRAGLTQSVVSAYESGARQPSLPTLQRLVAAAGFDLDVQVCERPASTSLAGPIGTRLSRHRLQVLDIATAHGLTNLRVFGSVARGDDTIDSDIDLLVDVPEGIGLIGLARCQRDLVALLGAPVDLVLADDFKAGMTAAALAEARPL